MLIAPALFNSKQGFLAMCGFLFSEYSNLVANEGCLLQMRPEHLSRAKMLVITLLKPYYYKNKLRTIQPPIFKKKLRTISLNLNLLVLTEKNCYKKQAIGYKFPPANGNIKDAGD